MNLDEYISLLESPLSTDAEAIDSLQSLLHYAPYCASARLLLLKAYFSSNDLRYPDEIERALLHASAQQSVYFLLHPRKHKTRNGRKSNKGKDNNYFEMVQHMEELSQRTGTSFQELARRFKEARLIQAEQHSAVENHPQQERTHELNLPAQQSKIESQKPQISETEAIKCIKNRDFSTAIDILSALSLQNPKKSSNFAAQIRFLRLSQAMAEGKMTAEELNNLHIE